MSLGGGSQTPPTGGFEVGALAGGRAVGGRAAASTQMPYATALGSRGKLKNNSSST